MLGFKQVSKTVFVFITVLHFVTAGDLLDDWQTWKIDHEKMYSEREETHRFDLWQRTRELVNSHNELFKAGNATFRMKLNALSDKTESELRTLLNPLARERTTETPSSAIFQGDTSVPDTVDWRNEGYVTSVKDQGQLGSCYSFSALGALEGQHYKATGELISLSEQQVVDCNQGGDGGYPNKVYQYAKSVGGVQSEKSYPYTAKVGTCEFDASKIDATLESYGYVLRFGDEDALKEAVATVGPISVSDIQIFRSFYYYDSGVYYESKCGNVPNLQGYHAMVAVGYGTQDGEDYWIVKNSWNTGWGEDGYIRMSRNRGNNCGIASDASYPVVNMGTDSGPQQNREVDTTTQAPKTKSNDQDPQNRADVESTTNGTGTRVVFTLVDLFLAAIIVTVLL